MELSRNVFQNMLFSQIKTGNQILDFSLNFVIISCMTYIFQYIKLLKSSKNILKYIVNFLFKSTYYVEININAESGISDKGGIKLNKLQYSKNFQAIIYHIKKVKPEFIYSKREADTNEKNSNIFDMFIPDQNRSFLIDSSKNIRCLIQLHDDKDDYYNETEKKESKKNHSIIIFSENKSTDIYDIEEFIKKCLLEYKSYILNNTLKDQYYFCFNGSEDNGDIIYFSEKIFNTNRTFDTVFFEEKDKYVNNLKFFLENEDWYKKKGIPYHCGILLHGTPGCGKTSIIKATLEYTKRHAVIVPLNRIKTCGELEAIFFESTINNKNIPTEKRIYIFEDVDCLCDVVKERDNIDDPDINKNNIELSLLLKLTSDSNKTSHNPEDELTLSCLLNIFDGILETPGRIIILTSNFPDKIDKALIRPGRIDINIELKRASHNIAKDMLESFYGIQLPQNNNIKDYQFTPAEIMNICQNNINNFEECIEELSK